MGLKNTMLVSIAAFMAVTSCNNTTSHSNLSVTEFEKAIAQKDVQILDVRTPGEYQSGHLANVLLADWNNQEEFKTRVQSLDKNKPVYTYCLSGGRSSAATAWLNENGYKAFNLSGGIVSWKNAGKRLEENVTVQQISVAELMTLIPADKTVLIDFSAVWCPPCKVMTPILDSLAAISGAPFKVVKIDGGQQTEICKELKVDQFPTFIVYKNGKETWRTQGVVTAKELVSNL
jgi:rhodanese-related sulfurtransferase